MTLKEQIIQEIEHLPETDLKRILLQIRQIKAEANPIPDENSEIWQAYLETKSEWKEVCRRLANS